MTPDDGSGTKHAVPSDPLGTAKVRNLVHASALLESSWNYYDHSLSAVDTDIQGGYETL